MMNKRGRKERIERYQQDSRKADNLFESGNKTDGLKILQKNLRKAAKNGDEDYRLFFEAESIHYKQPEYNKQINLMTAAIKWGEKEGLGKDGFLFRNKGAYYSWKGDEGEASKCLDKAIGINSKDWESMREKGVVLINKGNLVEAIKWFDKAIKINPKDSDSMRNKGVALSKRGNEDKAIKWFDKALEVNPKDSDAWRSRGVCQFNLDDKEGAFKSLSKAVRFNPDKWKGEFSFVCNAVGRKVDREWNRLFPGKKVKVPTEEKLPELQAFIKNIRTAYKEDADKFIQKKEEWENRRIGFLDIKSNLREDMSLMMVLRRWNSYTPAVPPGGGERSKGGGYFIWHNGKGTAIDPGYNFIENLEEAGCRICNIDNIVITHAHNDHTIEFESLLSLLREYNEKIKEKQTAEQKRVNIYLNNGAFKKFSGILDLKKKDYLGKIQTLNEGNIYEISGGIKMRVLAAYHDEVMSRDQSVGLCFDIPINGGRNREIVFTGDTGLFPLREQIPELTPDTKGPEVWKKYGIVKGQYPDLMVVHVGSIKSEELNASYPLEPEKACYANHLGIIGTARVITMCQPRLAIVSEFGEEMRDFRCNLIRGLQEKVIEPFCLGEKMSHIPRVIPGDLALIYEIEKDEFYCCMCEKWEKIDRINFGEKPRADEKEEGVYYFCDGKSSRFEQNPGQGVTTFLAHRKTRKGIYFQDDTA
jgi:tetratricopeptide (TPR) repeat protein